MRDLNYQLKLICKHSHEGSFETRVGRAGLKTGEPDGSLPCWIDDNGL